MKLLFLLMFWNFSQLKALNDHVQMEVCHIEITNEAPEFLKLAYQDWLRKIFFSGETLRTPKKLIFFRIRNKPIRDEISMHLSGNSSQFRAVPDSKRFLSQFSTYFMT